MALERSAAPLAARIGESMVANPKTQLAVGAASGAADVQKPGAGAFVAGAAPAVGHGLAAARPNFNMTAGDQQRLIGLAQQHGIPLTAADLTSNRLLNQIEAGLKQLPGSSGIMHKREQAQREAFNRAVMKVAGMDEPYATTANLQKNYQALGNELNTLASESGSVLDRQWATEVDRVNIDYGQRLETDKRDVFNSYLKDLGPWLFKARGNGVTPISGEQYDAIRKSIQRRARATDDPFFRDALEGLTDALDGAMERTAKSPELQQRWAEARRKYAAQVTIEDAMSRGTQTDREIGNIPFGGLEISARAPDRRGFARGKGQFNDLARIGALLAPKVPSSGTSERSRITRWLEGAVPAGVLTYMATTGDYITPLLAGGVSVGLPAGLAGLYGTEALTKSLAATPNRQQSLERGLVQSLLGAGSQYARERVERVPVADPVPPSRFVGPQQ
jgi:hypothetical protein